MKYTIMEAYNKRWDIDYYYIKWQKRIFGWEIKIEDSRWDRVRMEFRTKEDAKKWIKENPNAKIVLPKEIKIDEN